jgi:glycosyltransferase involved in cell wall biosynthesis
MSSELRGVAFIVHNLDAPGGMERQAARLAESLAARGVRVTIVTTAPARPWREKRGPIEVIRAPARPSWPTGLVERVADVVASYALLRRRRRFDAIYAVQYTGARHAALAAAATGRPAVVKFACGGEHGDFHVLGQRDEAEALRGALRRMDRYVIISSEIRREALAAGLDAARFVEIRNGVDTARFSPAAPAAELPELGAPGARKVVLFVGRHDTQKRLDVLLRAFVKVLAQAPEARLVTAGAGPRLEEYHALARSLGVAEKVTFLGARKDVESLYRAASVFVLPSAAEGLPNALLEALACGTPSVATAIPGTTDVVTHEKEALLVPLDDEAALAAAITRLLREPELAQRLAAAGRARIAAEFDMERIAEQYLALFAALAREARPPVGVAGRAVALAGLARRTASVSFTIARLAARDSITALVVGAKRRLGVEGEILPRLRRT